MINVPRLLSRGCSSKAKVGIGASRKLFVETSKRLSAVGCDVRLVRFADPTDLVASLMRSKIDVAVRGTLGSGETMKDIRLAFKLPVVMRTAIMQDSKGKNFLLTPVGIDEGNGIESRTELVERTMAYFSAIRWRPRIGILSKGRLEDVGRGEAIRSSIEEGELLAKMLTSKGYQARHYGILIEDALRRSDLIVAPDGVTGNLIFRSIHFVGGGKAFGAPVVNLDKIFVDTSRAKTDFSDSVMIAAGMAEAGTPRSPRA
jgi:putative methanogen marker protein 4